MERGGFGKKKGRKRTPVVLERWFGPQKPKAESLGSVEERRESEVCPEGNKDVGQGGKQIGTPRK